jgi:hypothetical protein
MKIQSDFNGERVAKRMFYLAWKACGGPQGMGVFQDRPGATEEEVWKNIAASGDYPYAKDRNASGNFQADYVFGRMMKMSLKFGSDWLEWGDSGLRPDYESWCLIYPTYQDLYDAALESLKKE